MLLVPPIKFAAVEQGVNSDRGGVGWVVAASYLWTTSEPGRGLMGQGGKNPGDDQEGYQSTPGKLTGGVGLRDAWQCAHVNHTRGHDCKLPSATERAHLRACMTHCSMVSRVGPPGEVVSSVPAERIRSRAVQPPLPRLETRERGASADARCGCIAPCPLRVTPAPRLCVATGGVWSVVRHGRGEGGTSARKTTVTRSQGPEPGIVSV